MDWKEKRIVQIQLQIMCENRRQGKIPTAGFQNQPRLAIRKLFIIYAQNV